MKQGPLRKHLKLLAFLNGLLVQLEEKCTLSFQSEALLCLYRIVANNYIKHSDNYEDTTKSKRSHDIYKECLTCLHIH